jgi:hypothetical protein
MPKVAIINIHRLVDKDNLDGYDNYSKIIDSITEWTDISDKEYELLKNHLIYNHNIILAVFPEPQKVAIKKTIASYLEEAKLQELKIKKWEETKALFRRS